MEDFNVELNEWWELAKTWFKEEMQKNLTTHRKDEEAYRRQLSAFKKAFPIFIYCNPNNSKPSSPIQELEDVECIGVIKEKHEKKPRF
jgi:hypothetical protein